MREREIVLPLSFENTNRKQCRRVEGKAKFLSSRKRRGNEDRKEESQTFWERISHQKNRPQLGIKTVT